MKTRDEKPKSLAVLLRTTVKGVQGHPEYGKHRKREKPRIGGNAEKISF